MTKKSRLVLPALIPAAVLMLTAASLAFSAEAAAETMYIQATKAELKNAPKMDAGKVADLKRGDQLTVLKKEGVWMQVKTGNTTGWISKLFLSGHKPVGQADLSKDVGVTLEKAARQRSNTYGVSAATRGLNATDRAREGRQENSADAQALKAMEDQTIDPAKLEQFKKAGKVGE